MKIQTNHIELKLNEFESNSTGKSDEKTKILKIRDIKPYFPNEPIEFQLEVHSFKTRIYKVVTQNGQMFAVKQCNYKKNLNNLKHEFRNQQKLFKVQCEFLKVPEPLYFSSKLYAYVMQYFPGQSLSKLMFKNQINFLNGCRKSGQLLAEIHNHWYKEGRNIEIENIHKDISAVLKQTQIQILNDALELLKHQHIDCGQVYLDFDPLNIIWNKNDLYLIDPPNINRTSILCWDLATFKFGLHKSLWKNIIKKPWNIHTYSSIIEKAKKEFQIGYKENYKYSLLEDNLFDLLMDILELQRVGEWIIGNKNNPFYFNNKKIKILASSIVSLPLLIHRRNQLIKEIQQKIEVLR